MLLMLAAGGLATNLASHSVFNSSLHFPPQPMFPPKPLDIFSPEGGCSEGLDAFRFFLNTVYTTDRSTPVAQSAPRNLLTRWDVSSIPANGIFLTKN